jgi:hypothetical protein
MSKILHASLALLGASIMVVEAQAQTTNYILKAVLSQKMDFCQW